MADLLADGEADVPLLGTATAAVVEVLDGTTAGLVLLLDGLGDSVTGGEEVAVPVGVGEDVLSDGLGDSVTGGAVVVAVSVGFGEQASIETGPAVPSTVSPSTRLTVATSPSL